MGTSSSKLEKQISGKVPDSERFIGLENFGNTCYCNSLLQALYFCVPFRERVLSYYYDEEKRTDSLLSALSELFYNISTHKRKSGMISPKKFVQKLRLENELFRGYMHQDAHEFFNFLINNISETLEEEMKNGKSISTRGCLECNRTSKTWLHELFGGTLTNETRCMTCETVTSRDELFLDLSVRVEQNTSISMCLRNFSRVETLGKDDKFHCSVCGSLQEAQRSMKVKSLPRILALHLKRFRYMEKLQRYRKLSYRVAFPLQLKVINTVIEDAKDPDREYSLFAVVVHVGSGPHHGHFVCMVKSHGSWFLFDDDIVELVDEKTVRGVFGLPAEIAGTTETGYILFYNSCEKKA